MRSPFDRPFGIPSPFGGVSGAALSAAASLLARWADSNGGLAADFTDNSMKIIDGATPANNFDGLPFNKLTFTRASTAMYYNSAGVLTQASSGVARIGYDPSTLAVRGLLVEEARTNEITYSNDFSNAAWTKEGSSFAQNASGPAGASTAWTMTASAGSSEHRAYWGPIVKTNTCQSIYVKAGTANFLGFSYTGNAIQGGVVNLTTGATSNLGAAASFTVTNVGSGWWRITNYGAISPSNTYLVFKVGDTAANATPGTSWTAAGTETILVYGAQYEDATFPSSYIPTTSASATRAASADNLASTAFNLSQTAGTLYVSGITAPGSGTQVLASIDDGTANERYRIVRDSSNNIRFIVTDGGVEQANINLGAVANSTAFKVAASWAANDFAACLNGGTVGTDTGGTLPTVTTLRLGCSPAGEQWGGHIKPAMHLPIALSDANLQSITA